MVLYCLVHTEKYKVGMHFEMNTLYIPETSEVKHAGLKHLKIFYNPGNFWLTGMYIMLLILIFQ
jgi:hypothetical protein